MKVYVNFSTCEVLSESGKDSLVWENACELSENEEFFEEFLGRYKRSDLLKCGALKLAAIHTDFIHACQDRAEEEFNDMYVVREVKN